MILITGATGTVGGATARLLAAAGRPVRLYVRNPASVTVAGTNVEVRVGDLADRDRLAEALVGVRAVLAVTTDPVAPAHDANLVAAAVAAEVRHVVKLSALAVTEPDADDLITRWQRDNEARLLASGLDWTLLRPRGFMSNTLAWAAGIRSVGVVRAPFGTARHAIVDPRDVAEVAAEALTDPEAHRGRAHALTGPRALSVVEQVAELSSVLDREIRFEEITVEQARQRLLQRYPEPVADALAASTRRGAADGKAAVEPVIVDLLGRPARDFRRWAADHRDGYT